MCRRWMTKNYETICGTSKTMSMHHTLIKPPLHFISHRCFLRWKPWNNSNDGLLIGVDGLLIHNGIRRLIPRDLKLLVQRLLVWIVCVLLNTACASFGLNWCGSWHYFRRGLLVVYVCVHVAGWFDRLALRTVMKVTYAVTKVKRVWIAYTMLE